MKLGKPMLDVKSWRLDEFFWMVFAPITKIATPRYGKQKLKSSQLELVNYLA